MAEVLDNTSANIFEAVCQAIDEDLQGHSDVAKAKIAEIYETLICIGYSQSEAVEALRAADQQLLEVNKELLGF